MDIGCEIIKKHKKMGQTESAPPQQITQPPLAKKTIMLLLTDPLTLPDDTEMSIEDISHLTAYNIVALIDQARIPIEVHMIQNDAMLSELTADKDLSRTIIIEIRTFKESLFRDTDIILRGSEASNRLIEPLMHLLHGECIEAQRALISSDDLIAHLQPLIMLNIQLRDDLAQDTLNTISAALATVINAKL